MYHYHFPLVCVGGLVPFMINTTHLRIKPLAWLLAVLKNRPNAERTCVPDEDGDEEWQMAVAFPVCI
jgi:hypothetical protein